MKSQRNEQQQESTKWPIIIMGARRRLRLRARVFTRRTANHTLNGVDYTVFNQIRTGCGGRGRGGRRMDFRPERVLLMLTLIAIAGGTALGIGLNPMTGSETTHQYIEFPGKLFLRMLKLMIVPLVISSNISSAATVTSRATRWLAFMSVSYYILTTFAAVSIGTALALGIGPGYWRPEIEGDTGVEGLSDGIRTRHALFSVMDLLRNMIPENAVKATFERTQTKYDKSTDSIHSAGALEAVDLTESIEMVANSTNMTTDNFQDVIRDVENHDVSAVLHFFAGLRKIMVYLVSIVIWFSPLGIMSLIAGELSKTQDLGATLRQLFMYTLTVVIGLLVHFFLVLTPLLIIVAKKNPIKFLYHMLQAIMIATGTASSLATLPATANCLENNVRLDQRVMRFMLPLGTTVNMDGTALYQIVAIIYIAQGLRISLDGWTVAYMVFLVVMSSVVTASVPSAGFFTIILTMQALGMPASQAPLVIPIDWFLDRLRTPVNVMSNAIGVAVVAEISKRKMQDKVKKEKGKKSLVPNSTVESGLHQAGYTLSSAGIGGKGNQPSDIIMDGNDNSGLLPGHHGSTNSTTFDNPPFRDSRFGPAAPPVSFTASTNPSDVILRSTKAYEFDMPPRTSSVAYFMPPPPPSVVSVNRVDELVSNRRGESFMQTTDATPGKTNSTIHPSNNNKKNRSNSYDLISSGCAGGGDGSCSVSSTSKSILSMDSGHKTISREGSDAVSRGEESVFLDIDLSDTDVDEPAIIIDGTNGHRQHPQHLQQQQFDTRGGEYDNFGFIIDGSQAAAATSDKKIKSHFIERF